MPKTNPAASAGERLRFLWVPEELATPGNRTGSSPVLRDKNRLSVRLDRFETWMLEYFCHKESREAGNSMTFVLIQVMASPILFLVRR